LAIRVRGQKVRGGKQRAEILTAVVGVKSVRDVRVGESAAAHVGWSNSGGGGEVAKSFRPALGASAVSQAKCAALR